MIHCPKCAHAFYPSSSHGDQVEDALRELVELKRMKDAGVTSAEYERRKHLAWQNAFRVCGLVEDPKP